MALEPHYRPYSSSCPRCRAALDLAAVQQHGVWYCSPACADGRPPGERERRVPDLWLTNRPRRFFRKRRPKELQSAPAASLAKHQ